VRPVTASTFKFEAMSCERGSGDRDELLKSRDRVDVSDDFHGGDCHLPSIAAAR
jgi:hypothetical protein